MLLWDFLWWMLTLHNAMMRNDEQSSDKKTNFESAQGTPSACCVQPQRKRTGCKRIDHEAPWGPKKKFNGQHKAGFKSPMAPESAKLHLAFAGGYSESSIPPGKMPMFFCWFFQWKTLEFISFPTRMTQESVGKVWDPQFLRQTSSHNRLWIVACLLLPKWEWKKLP